MALLVCFVCAATAAADGGGSQAILEELRAIKANQVAQEKQIVDLKIENSFLKARLSQAENSVQQSRQLKEVDFTPYSGIQIQRAHSWVVSSKWTFTCIVYV